jgi:hypothetical protein
MKPKPFAPAELGAVGVALLPVAGELDEYASRASALAPAQLVDRIMVSIAREPAPTPPVLLVRAVRNRSLRPAARYLAMSLEAALGVRRSVPLAVRAQAFAVVLIAVVLLGGGGVALGAGAAGVVQTLVPDLVRPMPTVQQTQRGPDEKTHGQRIRRHGATPEKAKSQVKSPYRHVPAAIDARGSDSDGKGGRSAKANGAAAQGSRD